jgi:hypothetical protein
MSLRIFDAIADAAEWHRLLEALPPSMQDVYFYPEYVALHRFIAGTRALLFAYQRGDGACWLYPFLLQPIEGMKDRDSAPTVWFDIETPYGYGGPLANTDSAEFLAEAHTAFSAWCSEQKVVAEFIRLHPLLQNERWLDSEIEVIYDRETVSLALTNFNALSREALPFDKMARYMLRRAERAGVRVERREPRADFDKFVALYRETMRRLAADEYYFFDEEYFRGLRELVAESGWLLAATHDEEWVAAALFLKGTGYLHYHLSATKQEPRLPGATNLLLYTAAQMGSRFDSLTTLHLGGGTTSQLEDSLLKFKRSMGNQAHAFHIGKRVHHPAMYASLRATWERTFPTLVAEHGRKLLCYRFTKR